MDTQIFGEEKAIMVEHAAVHEPTATAEGIAYSALAVAHADVLKACTQIRVHHNTDEAVQCINEAREQLNAAARMLTGTIWTTAQII